MLIKIIIKIVKYIHYPTQITVGNFTAALKTNGEKKGNLGMFEYIEGTVINNMVLKVGRKQCLVQILSYLIFKFNNLSFISLPIKRRI